MSSRSILIAVLGLTLNGCAVYDYDDDYDTRYYGGSGYSVQRYESYPVYPVYPQGYRYDYPRHDGYSQRYYYNPRHDAGRYDRDGHHDRYDRRDRDDRRDEHRGHDHPTPQPYGAGPSKQGWDGQRQQGREQVRRQQVSRPVAGQPVPQVIRGHERNQERRQPQRQDQPRSRYGEPANGVRHAH